MSVTIRPLCVGRVSVDKSLLTYLRNMGTVVTIPHVVWLIEGAPEKILVDTGPPSPEEASRYGFTLERSPDEDPIRALAAVGVTPEDIGVVILSHLHWDHASNNHLFPRARILVQREELRYAIAPLPTGLRGYGAPTCGMRPHYLGMPLTTVQGDKELCHGISLLFTPGHTPGSQSVVVTTESGNYVIASDTVPTFENWRGYPPLIPHHPGGIHVDLTQCFASFDKIEAAADFVLPGHDMAVFEREVYP